MEAFMLDGNAVAGLLHDVFGAEMTAATGTCDNCGASAPVGAVHVFRSAGVVLRCPSCGDVAVRIGVHAHHLTVEWRGTLLMEVERAEDATGA
jgi:predicted RNA-binding Zn-ribbon protein involved in translation (DUF1610 family)